jgi:putative chitinase
MIPVDSQTMREVAPHFTGELADHQAKIIREVGEVLAPTLDKFNINTGLRIAYFLGQTCHESAGFRTTEEFGSSERFNSLYGGRMGNAQPGDGDRYHGRGLLQLTGRDNYRKVGQALGLDLENDPLLAAQPATSLLIACQYWKTHNINPACDRDDIITVTKVINGGLNGLDERRLYTSKAKTALARIQAIQLSGSPAAGEESRPVLARGSKGDAVVQLQNLLHDLNFAVAVDGDFGPGTEVAVTRFQSEHDLTADGIVGPQTWVAMDAAKKAG